MITCPFQQFRQTVSILAGLGSQEQSGTTTAEAAAFADQAVAGLQRAVQSGWTLLDELKEPDFDPLRKRDDFQKLVKELEAKAAPARRTGPDHRSQSDAK